MEEHGRGSLQQNFKPENSAVTHVGPAQEERQYLSERGVSVDAKERARKYRSAAEQKLRAVEDLARGIKEIEQSLTGLKARFIDRLMSFRRIGGLKKQLGITQEQHATSFHEYLRVSGLAEGYEQIAAEEVQRDALLEKEKVNVAAEAQERSLSFQSNKHNCFFIHDLIYESKEASSEGEWFKNALAIVNGLAPTIPTSTLVPGSDQLTFGTERSTSGTGAPGVFIADGRIVGASKGDMKTIPKNLYERSVPYGYDAPGEIERAISERGSGHNELVISAPQVAGVYFRLDALIDDGDRSWISERVHREVYEQVPTRNLDMSMRERTVFGNRMTAGLNQVGWEKLAEAQKQGVPLYALSTDNKAFLISKMNAAANSITLCQGALGPADISDPIIMRWRDINNPKEERRGRAEQMFAHVTRAV